jgi:tetratricopeptide (TPR) repeat protein
LAIAYNNTSQYEKALPICKYALKTFQDAQINELIFLSAYNLSVISHNLNLIEELTEAIDVLESLNGLEKSQSLRVNLSVSLFHLVKKNYAQTEYFLQELEKDEKAMDEACYSNYLIVRLLFFIAIKNYTKSNQILNRFKEQRTFIPSAKYKFIHILTGYLTSDLPLYFYDRDFIEHPHLKLQLKLIQSLQQQTIVEAETIWKNLRDLAPSLYGELGEYNGHPCLFSYSLDKSYQTFKNVKNISMDRFKKSFTSKREELLSLLKESKTPLSKDHIFFALWGKKIESKDQVKVLIQLITRLRKKGYNITYKHGCYELIKSIQDSKRRSVS